MSVVVAFLNSKEFSRLLMKGKDQTFLTPEEINDAIPASIVDVNSIDMIMDKIEEARIQVRAPETDEEELEKAATENVEDPLSAAEEEELRTSSSDPVKLYLKKMGSVALLTREGEVKIAKEIEEGEKEIVTSCLKSKHALEEIIKLKGRIQQAEEQNEFVKDLVRGLDDESPEKEIHEVRERIFKVVDNVEIF
jgi:RNA polymerase primary sigma factor